MLDKSAGCSDDVLVERAAVGDAIAFSELIQKHYKGCLRLAIGMLKNLEDAEDATQEAFVRVHHKLSSFRGTASFSTWLNRIVINLCIDTMRRRKRDRRADVESDQFREALQVEESLWPNFDEADPVLQVNRKELNGQLAQAFTGLPEIHQAVLLLREVEGLSYDEIAETLEIKKGTVMSRLFHARKALQAELVRKPDGENL